MTRDLAQLAAEYTPVSTGLKVRCAEDITPCPIRWLWRRRLPLGRYVELVGYPGIGKTAVVMDMIARITTDGRWPDGSKGEVANVVIVAAEDEAEDVLVPRLKAAGADLSRVYFVDGIHRGANAELAELDLSQAIDFLELDHLVKRLGAGLVFVDALDDVLGAKYDGKGQTETRRALAPLRRLARQTGACMLGLRHPSKRVASGPALNQGNGSIAYGAVARGSFLITPDPDDAERRLLLAVKSNLSRLADTLAFRLESQPNDDDPPKVIWEPVADACTAADVLAKLRQREQEKQNPQAIAGPDTATWLRAILGDGVSDQREILDTARAAGYAQSSVYRAAEKIGIVRTVTGFGREKRSVWTLPPDPQFSHQEPISPHTTREKTEVSGKIDGQMVDPDEVARQAMTEGA